MKIVGKELKDVQVLISRYAMKHIKSKDNEVFRPAQTDIMKYLFNSKEIVYQKDIEREFKLRKSTISEILRNMESKGVIKKLDSKSDFRSKQIKLTQKGEEVLLELTSEIDKMEKLMEKDIDKYELEVFFKVIEQVKKNLQEN